MFTKSILLTVVLASFISEGRADQKASPQEVLASRMGQLNGTQTPYEILEQEYKKARPARLTDFPRWENVKKGTEVPFTTIRYVSPTTTAEQVVIGGPAVLVNSPREVVPAQPDRGPLFPRTPAVIENREAILCFESEWALMNMKESEIGRYVDTLIDLTLQETNDGLTMILKDTANTIVGTSTFRVSASGLIIAYSFGTEIKTGKVTGQGYTYGWR